MLNELAIIDFEIIWKKINNSLTMDEEIELSRWLAESPSHQQYLNRAIRHYRTGSRPGIGKAETEKAWRNFKRKGFKTNRNIPAMMISVAAAVAAIILMLNFLLPFKRSNSSHIAIQKGEQIHPGSNKATLILDDGSVYDLTASKKLLLKEGGSEIKSEGKKLEYSGKGSSDKELKYNTLSIPRGGEFFLQLADGTKVWLNSETILRYPIQFSGTERRVELTGEAFFEVARNEKVPFYVESGEQSVRVIGTEFNISSYKENPFIYTTLVKGRVEVVANNKPQQKQILVPNEQSTIDKIGGEISKRHVDSYRYVAWKEGRFVFDGQSLEEIMKILSKWYNVEVAFDRDELKNIRFTGNLKRYSDFGELLKKIQKTDEVAFNIENNKITIR